MNILRNEIKEKLTVKQTEQTILKGFNRAWLDRGYGPDEPVVAEIREKMMQNRLGEDGLRHLNHQVKITK